MSRIAPSVTIAKRPHRVRFETPTRVADGTGGFSEAWDPLDPPALFVEIWAASAQDLEQLRAGTVVASGTHMVSGPYHPQVNTLCRMIFGSRIFQIVGVANREERDIDMVLLCVELETIPEPTPHAEADRA